MYCGAAAVIIFCDIDSYLNSVHIRALTDSSHDKTNKCTVSMYPVGYQTNKRDALLIMNRCKTIMLQSPHLTNRFCAATENFRTSANILWRNLKVFKNPTMFFIYALLMLINSLKIIKIDRNMSEL